MRSARRLFFAAPAAGSWLVVAACTSFSSDAVVVNGGEAGAAEAAAEGGPPQRDGGSEADLSPKCGEWRGEPVTPVLTNPPTCRVCKSAMAAKATASLPIPAPPSAGSYTLSASIAVAKNLPLPPGSTASVSIRFFAGDGGTVATPGNPSSGPQPVMQVPTTSTASASLSRDANAVGGEFVIVLEGGSLFCVEFDHVSRGFPQ